MKRIFVTILYISLWLMIAPTVAYSQETLAERLKTHVYTLASDSLGGRKAGSEDSRKAAAYIAAQWKEIGIIPLVGETYYMPFRNQYNNLVGVIEGSHPVPCFEGRIHRCWSALRPFGKQNRKERRNSNL